MSNYIQIPEITSSDIAAMEEVEYITRLSDEQLASELAFRTEVYEWAQRIWYDQEDRHMRDLLIVSVKLAEGFMDYVRFVQARRLFVGTTLEPLAEELGGYIDNGDTQWLERCTHGELATMFHRMYKLMCDGVYGDDVFGD